MKTVALFPQSPLAAFIFTLLIACVWTPITLGEEEPQMRARAFQLKYAAQITDLPREGKVRVWIPVPPSNGDQEVKRLETTFPAKAQEGSEEKYGNQVLYFETAVPKSGELTLSTAYRVNRHEVRGLPPEKMALPPIKLADKQRQLLLAADAKVPVGGKPLELLRGLELPEDKLKLARLLYDKVDEHVKYDKSRPGYGQGDVLWVCDSRFGNCTDFHSLFISLARAQGLPARFEIGFSVPEKHGEGSIAGYHCWAFFFLDGQGWVPVDISEADKNPLLKDYYFGNLTENRVTFSEGRDLTLVPPQAGPPLNFFIYPYVEVDGKPWPREKVKLEMTYKDE